MSRYFSALLAFMVVFAISGIMFDGFESTRGVTITIIASVGAAVATYLIVPRTAK